MEGAVCNAHEGSELRVMGILAVALKEAQGSDEITLLEEVTGVWEPHLFLLLGLDLRSVLFCALNS